MHKNFLFQFYLNIFPILYGKKVVISVDINNPDVTTRFLLLSKVTIQSIYKLPNFWQFMKRFKTPLYSPEEEGKLDKLVRLIGFISEQDKAEASIQDFREGQTNLESAEDREEARHWLSNIFVNPYLISCPSNYLSVAEASLSAMKRGWEIEPAGIEDQHSDFAEIAIRKYLDNTAETLKQLDHLRKVDPKLKNLPARNEFYPLFNLQRAVDRGIDYGIIMLAGRNVCGSNTMLWGEVLLARTPDKNTCLVTDMMYNTFGPHESIREEMEKFFI